MFGLDRVIKAGGLTADSHSFLISSILNDLKLHIRFLTWMLGTSCLHADLLAQHGNGFLHLCDNSDLKLFNLIATVLTALKSFSVLFLGNYKGEKMFHKVVAFTQRYSMKWWWLNMFLQFLYKLFTLLFTFANFYFDQCLDVLFFFLFLTLNAEHLNKCRAEGVQKSSCDLRHYCPVSCDIFLVKWTVTAVGASHFNKRISHELEPTFKPLSFSYLCCVGRR